MLSNASINKQLFSSPFPHVSRCEATMAEKNENNFLKRSQNTRRLGNMCLFFLVTRQCFVTAAFPAHKWVERRQTQWVEGSWTYSHDAVKRFRKKFLFATHPPLKLIHSLRLFLSPGQSSTRNCKYFNWVKMYVPCSVISSLYIRNQITFGIGLCGGRTSAGFYETSFGKLCG